MGLRARLTAFVTIVFAAALTLTAFVVLDSVENRLIDDTRSSAEGVLANYLDSIYGGIATVGIVESDLTTQFFYLDDQGSEIDELSYFNAIFADFDAGFAEPLTSTPGEIGDPVDTGGFVNVRPFADQGAGNSLPLIPLIGGVDPDTGVLVDPTGEEILLSFGPEPVGEPTSIDRDDDVVAVAQTLRLTDASTVAVGVSIPLRPVTDSLDTFRQLLWIAVPLLVGVVALITWLATSRALRPVGAIIGQASKITSTNIHERVPVHAANDEINAVAATINGMLQRLEDAQNSRHQLVADASHELRSPVAASQAQLDVALANPDEADWVATAKSVLGEQQHLGALIADLLALSKLDEATPELGDDVDLDEIVLTECDRHDRITTHISAPQRVRGNSELARRAIRNLVDNAVHHGGSAVEVSLTSIDGFGVVHVDDNGPGIPNEDRESIFDRFARLDDARDRASGGAGLGLAIARQIAKAHGGEVVCGDSPLGGARFTITFVQ